MKDGCELADMDENELGAIRGYDPTDMPVVIVGIERWHREGAWAR